MHTAPRAVYVSGSLDASRSATALVLVLWNGTRLGCNVGVWARAAGRGVEVEPEEHDLGEDVHGLLLEERRREPRGLQAVDRVDQLRLPDARMPWGAEKRAPSAPMVENGA